MTAPDSIWTEPPDIFDGMGLWYDAPHSRLTEYRRADLPPTLAQALELPEIAALVESAKRVDHDNTHGNGFEGFRYGREWLHNALAKVRP